MADRGLTLSALPDSYLDWLCSIELRPMLRAAVDAEMTRRFDPPAAAAALECTAMARRIVDTGYKCLAHEIHPDVGGTHEGMQRLNMAVASLRKALQ